MRPEPKIKPVPRPESSADRPHSESAFDGRGFVAGLPNLPGVYRMLAPDGAALYVGKAKDLKKRVGSYFSRSAQSPRIAMMVAQVGSILGRDFHYELIRHVSPFDEMSLQEGLEILADAGIVRNRAKIDAAVVNAKRFLEVQEEFGSEIRPVTPEPALLAAGDDAIAAVGQKLLYARVDFVRNEDAFRLMELELVEPSLYLRYGPGAAERFADAVASLLG